MFSIVNWNSMGVGVADDGAAGVGVAGDGGEGGVSPAGGLMVEAGAVSVTTGDSETGKDGGDSGAGVFVSLQAHSDTTASSTIIIATIFFIVYLLVCGTPRTTSNTSVFRFHLQRDTTSVWQII